MASRNKKKKQHADVGQKVTAQEMVAVGKFLEKRKVKSRVRLKLSNDNGNPRYSVDHPHKLVGQMLLMETLGTADEDFMDGIIQQLANAGGGGIDERQLNFLLAVIKGIVPRDQVETMLAAQMAAIHAAAMAFARLLARVETIQQQDSAAGALIKLMRTFAMQVDALKRYRTGGEQKVTVQHVSVSEGGQAIVGNVTQASRENTPSSTAAEAPALTHAMTAAMPIIGESKEPDPVPARARRRRNK